MRLAMLLLALSITVGDPIPVLVLDQPQRLAMRQSARLPGTSTAVTFALVNTDSRCPEGARCIWAGEAIVTLRVVPADGAETKLRLRVGDAEPTIHDGLAYRATALTPYPKEGAPIAAKDYVLTLVVTRPAP
jgi:hypothetical protein